MKTVMAKGSNMTDPYHQRRILIVDDEPQTRILLKGSLTGRCFQVNEVRNRDHALDLFNNWHPDLIITDLFMPQMSGISLCQEIRRQSTVPIIILSIIGEEAVKVEALESGADDYITKPFGVDELLARVRAVLRRASQERSLAFPSEVGSFRVNPETHRVSIGGGPEIALTPKEFDLLVYFMKNPRKVITQKTLLNAIWGQHSSECLDSVRALARRIRKKIEPDATSPSYLRTEPWIGYRFEPGD